MSTIRVAFTAALTAAVLLGGTSASAAAATPSHSVRRHLTLTKSDPKNNDSLKTSPKTIKLWFSETVQASATSIRITGPNAHAVTLGAVSVDAKMKMAPAVAMVTETLKSGQYQVEWKTMADDGHPSTGKFMFNVK